MPLPLPQLFDYALPPGTPADPGLVGRRVRVPFGKGEKIGVVAAVGETADTEGLRAVAEILDDAPLLDGELLASLRWLARYLHAPLGEVLAGEQHPVVLAGDLNLPGAVPRLAVGWRGRDPAALWLSASCAGLLLQLGFESLRAFVDYAYPWHGPRLFAIAASAWLFGFSLLGFFLARFATPRPRRWLLGLGLPALLPFLFSGDVVAVAVLLVFLGGSLAVAVLAWRRRHRGAGPFIFVLGLLLALLLLQAIAFLDRWLYLGFALVLVLCFADHVRLHARTVRERDAARFNAQRLALDLLRQHLKPHFLLNSLAALAGWIEEAPRTAVRMVHALADEFRTLVDVADRRLVPLEEELALCRAHLQVMGFRKDQPYTLEADVMKTVEARLGQLQNTRIEIVPELRHPGIILESENGLIDGSLEGVFANIDRVFGQVLGHE